MEDKMIEIRIIGQEGDFLLIADLEKGYESKIDSSLIAANELEIIEGKVKISESMYQHWFQEAITNAFEERCKLFYSNIPLFVEKQEIILQNPRFYSIKAPRVFYSGFFIAGQPITLGALLRIWQNEENLTQECNCGGRKVIYSFSGSMLSGMCVGGSICPQCKEKGSVKGGFPKLYDAARNNCHPIKPVSENPIAIKDLIAILEGKITLESISDSIDDVHSVSDSVKIRIGSQTVSGDTFASLFNGPVQEIKQIKKFFVQFDYPLNKKGIGVSAEFFSENEETAREEALEVYKEQFGDKATGKIIKFVCY